MFKAHNLTNLGRVERERCLAYEKIPSLAELSVRQSSFVSRLGKKSSLAIFSLASCHDGDVTETVCKYHRELF